MEEEKVESLRLSQAPDSHHHKRVLFYSVAALLLSIISGGVGYLLALDKSQSSQTPTYQVVDKITSTVSPTMTIESTPATSWPFYTSAVGYSFQAPPSWNVTINNDDSLLLHQDYVGNVSMTPKDQSPGMSIVSAEIEFPISIKGPHFDLGKSFEQGLKGLENSSNWGPGAVTYNRYTQIDGKTTLIVKSISPNTPVGDEPCLECSTKDVFIDLNNGKILEIAAHWTKEEPSFEDDFDKVYSSIKFQ